MQTSQNTKETAASPFKIEFGDAQIQTSPMLGVVNQSVGTTPIKTTAVAAGPTPAKMADAALSPMSAMKQILNKQSVALDPMTPLQSQSKRSASRKSSYIRNVEM